MEDTNEEFEPLFDYTRVQPRDIVCLDDDSEDASSVIFSKRRKISEAEATKKLANVNVNVKDAKVVNLDKEEDKEEDWLPPPPKSLIYSNKTLEEGSTLKALRHSLMLIGVLALILEAVAGFCIFLGKSLVSWKAKKHVTVSQSSTEAEYRTLSTAAGELVWPKQLLSYLSISTPSPALLFYDNTVISQLVN